MVTSIFLSVLLYAVPASAADWSRLEKSLGRKGTLQGEEYKISTPHPELGIVVDGFSIVPDMGATSWIVFATHGKGLMAMGDIVLLEDEFKPVQKAAIDAGLTITAIHNHFLRDQPKVMYMHLGGMGDAAKLGSAVRRVLEAQQSYRTAKKLVSGPDSVTSNFDPAEIVSVLGHSGKLNNGVYKVVIGRPDVPLSDMGAPISSFMGFNTWMAFQGTKERAAVSGDFAMRVDEVDAVIRALVTHGIEVTAVHNHMVTEEPRIFFLHFWGVDSPSNLAKGLRAALDKTGARTPAK